ncbi:MAG: hypothetical protein EZS26_000281 [Candidatus Ordinivivax streblomastigis]|uniref:GT-D fold-like domain-containing protein n=1 Tax=Candidatus Ordinivivax streblomastigis TaxID=2540710 RepID=A0A5M8P693_9BACT|nr:MAG: hypothetical protein EZS26_000281 [Candidatus Ordinivivax streblomastigis]
MNQLSIFTLKALRKLYAKTFSVQPLANLECIQDADIVSELIYDKLMSDKPCMIARFGSTELMTLVNYLGVYSTEKKNIFKYIQCKRLDWWWNKNILQQMQQWSGFFPPTVEKIEQFCELMMENMKELDVLGSWLSNENYVKDNFSQAELVHLHLLEPYFAEIPWTKALEGKKVLVVHPFAELIEKQYQESRTKLFKNPNVLPLFHLQTIKAVQSLGGESNGFKDWFEALDWMKQEIDKKDYDICLIGCGAYGFPLAAYVKKQGKKAIHLGGASQLLFGIRGKRWENPNYEIVSWGISYGFYPNLMNEYWVRPTEVLKSKNANQVEGACYW